MKFKKLLSENEQKKLCYLTEKLDDHANVPIKKMNLETINTEININKICRNPIINNTIIHLFYDKRNRTK